MHAKLLSVMAIALSLSISCATPATDPATDSVEIPLKEIWALDMPGTRDIHQLEPEIFKDIGKRPSEEQFALLDKSLTGQFEKTLKFLNPFKERSAKGFAVSGTGREALRNATRARLETKSDGALPASKPVSIVFFAHGGGYVGFEKIIRRGRQIEIHFRHIPRSTMQVTAHFALIPLGNLASGTYQVEVIPTEWAAGNRNVCKSFSFLVEA